jgi:hypothetical protein
VTEVLAQDGSYVVVSQANANIDLTYKLIKCMLPEGLLTDEVVNFYDQLLQERIDRTGLKMHFFNSFFLAFLEDGYSYDKVDTHTHKQIKQSKRTHTHTHVRTHLHAFTHSHTGVQLVQKSKVDPVRSEHDLLPGAHHHVGGKDGPLVPGHNQLQTQVSRVLR